MNNLMYSTRKHFLIPVFSSTLYRKFVLYYTEKEFKSKKLMLGLD
jgi:hypothetical protein